MSRDDSFRERMLERIRNPESSDTSQKKKRLSRIFLLIDAIVIAVILFYFADRETEDDYKKSSVKYGAVVYTLSVIPEGRNGDYLVTLTADLKDGEKKAFPQDKSVANISLRSGDSLIIEKTLTDTGEITSFTEGGAKIFPLRIARKRIDIFAEENPGLVIAPDRTLFSRKKPYLPLELSAVIHTGEGVSTSLNFNHRINK